MHLSNAHYNTFNLNSKQVTFDLTGNGMSALSQEQLSGIFVGDEAYAGSRNFLRLEDTVKKVLGHTNIIPTHNLIGSKKLLSRVLAKKDAVVLTNGTLTDPLFQQAGMKTVCIKRDAPLASMHPSGFSGSIDREKLKAAMTAHAVAFILIETCPRSAQSQPFALKNLKAVSELANQEGIPVVLDISFIVENAAFMIQFEKGMAERSVSELIKQMVSKADITIMDAAEDARSNAGGFITAQPEQIADKLRNQVVVYEGLHTYGGMAGRTMEIVARGLEEMASEKSVAWRMTQIAHLFRRLGERKIPAIMGGNGVSLPLEGFLPHFDDTSYPLFALSSALYLCGGIRAPIRGRYADLLQSDVPKTLHCELPRDAFTNEQLDYIAQVMAHVYSERKGIQGLSLVSAGEWIDEFHFDLSHKDKPLCPFNPGLEEHSFEPWRITAIEHIGFTDRAYRAQAAQDAGYNTFLLKSEDIGIDALTDSGTSAMSLEQWSCMLLAHETPYTSKDYEEFVEAVKEGFGYEYVVPTHQGRAAEFICSQTLIHEGDRVPGNMYFTTTKLHQELAGGTFTDVIVDEAHDPESTFDWKGNINLEKMEKLVKEVGDQHVPYVSFETCVNMAGGQPVSMQNMKEVQAFCKKHGILVLFDATRCAENAYFIKKKDPLYADRSIKEILKEMMSYGDGCTVSSKKDCLVNICGFFATNDKGVYTKAQNLLRTYEGTTTTGGLSCQDLAAHTQGVKEMVDYHYIRARVEQTQYLGNRLLKEGIPIVRPPGGHAIFLNARKFFDHLDQDQYPAQALAIEIFIEAGIRSMERGNVSKGRNPLTGENFRPALELVRVTLPRRVYTNSHMELIVDAVKKVYERRHTTKGLRFTYEPKELRFFQGRFDYVT